MNSSIAGNSNVIYGDSEPDYGDYYDEYYYYGESWNCTEDDYALLTRAVEILDTYYVPTVVGIGLLGNTVSFLVLVSTYLNRLSLSVYLAALAVADSAFLCALSISWLEYAGIQLFHTNGWCQITVFTSYVSSFLSTWFVVGFTVERYIAICFPLKRPEMCTVSRARITVSALSLFAVASYACTLKITGVNAVGRYMVCQAIYISIYKGLTYVDAIVTFVIPFLSIVILNIKIFHRISYFYSKRRLDDPSANHIYCTTLHHQHQHTKSSSVCLRNRAQVKVTKFLLVVSSVFIIINLPSYVVRVRAFLNHITAQADTRLVILLQQMFQFLFYMNFAINFFLYSLCSGKFRHALYHFGSKLRYKVTNFVRLSYRLFRGISSTNSAQPNAFRGGIELPLAEPEN